jgi:trigger factor
VADVSDDEVKAALARIADNNRPFAAKEAGAKAADGDKLTIDFKGSIDGELFQGGSAEGTVLVIGSNSFIPGFEPQLIGAKVGDDVEVKVTFPAEYQAAHLAGKDAVFAVKVHAIAAPGDVKVDDDFAKTLGLESLAKLEDAIRAQMSNDYAGATRRKVKRKLLDALDVAYRFDLPEGLVEQEFDIIWRNLTSDMERAGQTFEQEGTTEEKARAAYRGIAERRVRLGLLLAEVGDKGQIKVADDEVNRALFERARQFPGQERKFVEFYRENPDALAQLRAPIFEEKVVDYILELATITEQKVSKEALLKEDEDEKA